MAFFFVVERGKPITKFIEIEYYFQVGISKVFSSPIGVDAQL